MIVLLRMRDIFSQPSELTHSILQNNSYGILFMDHEMTWLDPMASCSSEPSPYAKTPDLSALMAESAKFITNYQWVWDIQMTKFFQQRHWTNIPNEWHRPLMQLTNDQLNQLPLGFTKADWPSSLKTYVRAGCSSSVSLERTVPQWVKDRALRLDSAGCKKMTRKKIHEVSHMTGLVWDVCHRTGCTLVLDIGSGLGYLGQILSQRCGLMVVGVEREKERVTTARERANTFYASLTNSPATATANSPATATANSPATATANSPATATANSPATATATSPATATANSPATATATSPATDTANSPATDTATSPATATANSPATATANSPATATANSPATDTTSSPATDTAKAAKKTAVDRSLARKEEGEDVLRSKFREALSVIPEGQATACHLCVELNIRDTRESRARVTALLDELKSHCGRPVKVCLVGLHCCGDLTPAVLRLFADNEHPDILSLVLVGCCYHKMTYEEPVGFSSFPMSARLHSQAASCSRLNVFAMRLAAQETKARWRDQSDEQHRAHERNVMYRGILQAVWGDSSLPPQKTKKYTNFEKYAEDMARQLKSPQLEGELLHYHSLHAQSTAYIEAFTALQVCMQGAMEGLVVADRVTFLQERGFTPAVVPLFDDLVSPRNIAIVTTIPGQDLSKPTTPLA